MATAKPIEFAEQRHEFFYMNRKNYRLHYSHDERIPEDLRGEPVATRLVTDIYYDKGQVRSSPHEYEDYYISSRLKAVLPMRKTRRYKVHRLNYLFFHGTEPPVVHHRKSTKDNGPSDLVGSTPRHNVWEELDRKSTATAPYVMSRFKDGRETFYPVICRKHVRYAGRSYRTQDEALVDAAFLNVVLDGPDRAHSSYVDLLYAKDLFKDAMQHRRDGTFPDSVTAYHRAERKAVDLKRRK